MNAALPQTLVAWLDYIGRQHVAEIVMGLERVRKVWERMGSPRAPVNIVVGGTNGKGSTCAMLEAMLRAAGYKTGFYSSPHFERYNERVRIGGQEAGDAMLAASFEKVEAARTSSGPFVPLTYFEFATLSALQVFAEQSVEVAILEVGLGGRLDAVNIIDADASAVVSVDLDHQSYLGDTREQIALEKAQIFRPGRPAIFGDHDPPRTLLEHAAGIGASLQLLGRDFRFERQETQWRFVGREAARSSLPFPALRGGYQLKNASAALAVLDSLRERLPVSQGQVKRGLLEVEWPGRMQVLPGRPTVVLDVAHNPHAARALDDALGGMGFHPNTYAVFGMLKDKDIDSVIAILKGRIDHWFIAGLDSVAERGATLETVAGKLDRQGLSRRFSRHVSILHAYAAAREQAGQDDRIVAFGSFHTVAEIARLRQPT